ncbi:hypothetical protein V4T84_003106 [Vibrio parahaemolyticus]
MDILLQPYIVAFVDLLGFTAMVKHDCENSHDQQKYINALYDIHTKTKELKNQIEGLQITQFSDSVVLAIPYSKGGFVEFVKVVADYQFDLLSSGVLCRGGISYGKHYSSEDFLFSHALIDAYHLESKVASTPRILVSQELIDLIYPNNSQVPSDLLSVENDNMYFINYLNAGNPEDNWSAIEKSIPKVLSSIPSIRSKQLWVIDYYNHLYPNHIVIEQSRFGG